MGGGVGKARKEERKEQIREGRGKVLVDGDASS